MAVTTIDRHAPRRVQPKCAHDLDGRACNHPLSFHGKKGRCRALGCPCDCWVEPVRAA